MLTRRLFFAHNVTASFTLHTLHKEVNDAKFHVIATSPTLTLLGGFQVSINQLLDSKGPLKEFVSHFPLPEVIL